MGPSIFRKNAENFEIFMPEVKNLGDMLPMNFEMLLRIETNLKLNPIDKDGKGLIPEKEKEYEEVHFLKMESKVCEYEIRFGTILKLIKEMANKPDLKFSDWTLTDFDLQLNGNPHI